MSADLPPGYPYQSITAPYASTFPPYHLPPAGMNTDRLLPHRSRSPPPGPPPPLLPPPLLPPLHHGLLEEDIKPRKAEPSETLSVLKQEPDIDPAPRPLPTLRLTCNPELPGEDEPPLLSHRVLSPPPPPPLQQQQQEVERQEVQEEEKEERRAIKIEASSYPVPLLLSEAKPELVKDAEGYPACTSAAPLSSPESTAVCPPQEQACDLKTRPDSPTDRLLIPGPLEVAAKAPERPPRPSSCTSSNSPPPLAIGSEDPMAGLLALAVASEMVAVRAATPPTPTLLPQMEDPTVSSDCGTTGALEKVALEGMALLSQMAQQELENMRQERGE